LSVHRLASRLERAIGFEGEDPDADGSGGGIHVNPKAAIVFPVLHNASPDFRRRRGATRGFNRGALRPIRESLIITLRRTPKFAADVGPAKDAAAASRSPPRVEGDADIARNGPTARALVAQ
jgi:hypothetical protein